MGWQLGNHWRREVYEAYVRIEGWAIGRIAFLSLDGTDQISGMIGRKSEFRPLAERRNPSGSSAWQTKPRFGIFETRYLPALSVAGIPTLPEGGKRGASLPSFGWEIPVRLPNQATEE